MTLSTMNSVETFCQNFYNNGSIPPITLEQVDLSSLTVKSVDDLITMLPGTRLGVAALYGEKCVLVALAFSSESRVLLITMDGASGSAKQQKNILRDGFLCNILLEKHGYFVECLAVVLYLDLGLYIHHTFDLVSDGDRRGSMATYKGVLA